MKYKITISKVMAGRIKPDDIIDCDFENSKYGFYWWFWKPVYSSNRGKFKNHDVVDVDVTWFCFSVGLIFWPKNKRKQQETR